MRQVLLVEDHADSAEPIARVLRKHGYRVVTVPNGREALAVVMATMPDVLLLDVRMPELDGITFLGIIRSYLRLAELPVFIITGYPQEAEQQAATHKVEGVFRKGEVSLDEIVEAVKRVAPPRDFGV